MLPVKVLVSLLALTTAVPASAQVSVSLHNGFEVHLIARIEPGSVRVPSAVRAGKVGLINRIVLDRSQKRYFVYDVLIESQDGVQGFQVRLEPSSLSPTELAEMQIVDATWTAIPLLKYPLVPRARVGDTVAIDLLENRSTGQKVVDYLAFRRSNEAAAPVPGHLRDLSVDDVELQLENFRISVNGMVLDASTRVGGSISGPALWFYTPDRGRFILSLRPNPKLGFRRAGEVTDRSLSFVEAGERYDIHSTSRIAPAGGRLNLYVLHDRNWRPAADAADLPLIVGAADRAEWLMAK